MIEDDDDVAGLFDLDEFAVPALWSGRTVPVLFDDAYRGVAAGLPIEVAGSEPRAIAQASTVPGIKVGDPIEIRSVSYVIRRVEPDGSGAIVRLILEGPRP